MICVFFVDHSASNNSLLSAYTFHLRLYERFIHGSENHLVELSGNIMKYIENEGNQVEVFK